MRTGDQSCLKICRSVYHQGCVLLAEMSVDFQWTSVHHAKSLNIRLVNALLTLRDCWNYWISMPARGCGLATIPGSL